MLWYKQNRKWVTGNDEELTRVSVYTASSVIIFVWLNAILLRTLHFWLAIPFNQHYLFNSSIVQTSMSILWACLSVILTTMGTRKKVRPIWFVGVGLISILILKLIFVDYSQSGTIARVVSFIGVGLLLILIGYLAPVPPKQQEK